MVVEDDALVRNFVIAQLQSLGYRTVGAANGPAALDLIEGGQPFDLLFTDVIMPGGMTGRELAEKALKLRPGIKVLYTSGYTDDAIVHEAISIPAWPCSESRYRKADLAQKTGEALAGSQP